MPQVTTTTPQLTIYLLCLTLTLLSATSQQLSTCLIHHKHTHDDVTTTTWMFKEITLRPSSSSRLACATHCLQHKACLAFMVNLDLSRCRLHAASITSDDVTQTSPGFKYYETCRAAGNIGSKCNSSSDCGYPNMECTSQHCQCDAFHHYDPNTQRCESGCDIWGSDFAAFPSFFIPGRNIVELRGEPYIELQGCRQACVEASFTCKSIDFVSD